MKMQNNNVRMIVNLGTNPTVKADKNGRKVARFSAACAEKNTNANATPEGAKKTKWYSVVSWGSVAEVAERFLHKGKRVILCGHLTTHRWTDKKGNVRTKDEIVATHLVLLDSGKPAQAQLPNAA